MNKDYYKILGVSESASISDIKKAYRKLAMKYHPDKNKDDPASEEKFKEIADAYSTLGDTKSKNEYDTKRSFSGFGNTGGFQSRRGFSGGFGNFSFDDFVNESFGRGFKTESSNRRRPNQSTSESYSFDTSHLDIRKDLKFPIKDIINSKIILIEFERNTLSGKEEKKIKFEISLRKREYTIHEKNNKYFIHISLDGMGNESSISKVNMWGEKQNFIIFGKLNVYIEITSEIPFKLENGNIIEEIEMSLFDAIFDSEEDIIVDSVLGKKYRVNINEPKDLSSLKFTVKNQGIFKKNKSIGDYIANIKVISPDITKLNDEQVNSLKEILSNKELY